MPDIGNLYVVAAPSGTGKTTLVKALVDSLAKITVSISHTTRPKRPNEMHGVNYYFVERPEFERMIAHHDFLEFANIFDHYYGTSKSWVEETMAKGLDIIFEIDWQGHQQIKKIFPAAIGIFILPPTFMDLSDRLLKRNQDSPEIIKKRLADVCETISHLPEFDYVVINDDFEKALHDLKTIVEAGRLLERVQHYKFSALIENLKKDVGDF
jgi:guanylate kinase